MNNLQRLSLGMQTFSEIRDENCLYIDKTAHLVDMIDNKRACFLSRPRRFGKSLTLSTLESLLLGQKEYFEGLAAYSWLSEKKFSPRPVISMSLFGITGCRGLQNFEELLQGVVETAGENNKISLRKRLSTNMFKDLIWKLCDKHGKRVAILIDEYDHPITEFINDPEKANAIRSILQNFYSVLKDLDKNISFIFMTGVTKSVKGGMFSALNNLTDISLWPDYATMCGFTQEEIEKNCIEYVKKVAIAKSMSTDEILAKIESYYNGYSFDGKQFVYNPYDVLNLFDTNEFDNFWFTSATPSHLEKYLATRSLIPSDYIIEAEATRSDIAAPKEIENCSPAIFLYQAGYLTLRATDNREKFILVTPNEEVTESMLRLAADYLFAAEKAKVSKIRNTLVEFFKTCDTQGIIQEFNGILELCRYDTYEVAATSTASYECYNRDVIAAFLAGTCELDVSKEVFGSLGRADLVIKLKDEYPQKVYIFELKMLKKGKKPESVVQEAKDQILDRRYSNQHFFTTDTITAFAIALDREHHNIAMYDTMELKKDDVLEKSIKAPAI